MRQLIRTYSITGLHEITITDYTFTKQDIRLIINESLASVATTTENLVASVLVSSTKKDNVVNVLNGVITLANTTAALTVGDELTIEIDIDNIAKEANATANKNAIINAIQDAVGSAPSGSEITTIFAWLTTIYEYLAGQTPEEIPEGLGDRINLLLQFFGLPQALPEYQSMPLLEMTGILEDIMTTIDPDLTAEEAAAITEEVLSSDSSDDSSD